MTVSDGHQPAGAGVLGDHAGAVRRDLREREARRCRRAGGEHGEAAEVAARRLRAALDHVARDHGAGELVEVVAPPAEAPDRGTHDDGRRR